MTKARSGGGITSNKLVETRNPKVEPTVYRASPGATSRLGNMVGEGTPLKMLQTQGGAYSNPIGPTPSVAGPGGGRMVMKSGSQGTHGSTTSGTARPGADKEIFPGFPGRR
jgi:hypothetical protein